MGAVKTAGRGREVDASPDAERTLTVGRDAILMSLEDVDDSEQTVKGDAVGAGCVGSGAV